ncbi:AAA family ATPase [Geodermatophilus sp. SYSU D01176]
MSQGGASEAEARAFAAAVRSLLAWVHAPEVGDRNEVAALVKDVLGDAGAAESVVTRRLPPFEHVNLQTALDAWSAEEGRRVEVRGIALPPHYGGVTLQQLVSGEALPPLRLCAPGVVDLPDGPDSTLACLRLALLLVTDARGRYVLMVQAPVEHHEPVLTVELAGLPVRQAQAVLGEVERLSRRLNVYRGQLLEVTQTPMGQVSLEFLAVPATGRDDVVLPEPVLDRIERHALGVAEHRAALVAAGQHLKRGLLLFGPPGTGKTHTAGYLLGRMTEYTRLVLTGRSLGVVGAVTELARELQPAVVVLEDVDLVAADRSFGPGGSPVLFDLLDAMDGAAADADLLFVLTTNRADLLEPALAARPGRVDVAVEIDLPDAGARRRLLELYGRDVPLQVSDADVEAVVERSDGVTASFLKELLRRAVLEALREAGQLTAVTGQHLTRALDDLLDSTQSVTRTLLGVGVDPATLPDGGPVAVPARPGWLTHPGGRHRGRGLG